MKLTHFKAALYLNLSFQGDISSQPFFILFTTLILSPYIVQHQLCARFTFTSECQFLHTWGEHLRNNDKLFVNTCS